MLTYILVSLLILSTAVNVFLYREYKKPAKKTVTVDAQAMLHDMMSGGAMLEIRVLNTEDYFLKSPRGR
jgi:hypothetical protein